MTQTIDCNLEDAFQTATDAENYPVWNPLIIEVTPLTGDKVDLGAQFIVKIPKFGNETMEVTDFRPNESVTYSPISRMLAGFHRWDFTEQDGKTRVDHTVKMSLKGVFRLLLPLTPLLKMLMSRNTRTDATSLQLYLEKSKG